MIPKIAHFHWTGPTMSWLRLAAIASFKKHNPGWEVRVHDTPDDIRAHGLKYPQEADWTWWRALHKYGGFQVATDIVFVRPIPDQWLDCDFTACLNGGGYIYHNAAMGMVPQHDFALRCEVECEHLAKSKQADFQAFGPTMLTTMQYDFSRPDFVDQSMEAFCSVRFNKTASLWTPEGVDIHDDAIGIHWYGGDPTSRMFERDVGPGSDHFIVQLAERELHEPSSV